MKQKIMFSKSYILMIFVLAMLILSGCGSLSNSGTESDLTIAATFYPYYDFTRQIVGDVGTVYSVVPPTSDPHSFEPSIRDIEQLQKVDFFVVSGVEFEAFENQLIASVPSSARVIQTQKGITLLAGGHDHHHDEHADDDHDGEDDHDDEHADDDHNDDVDDDHDDELGVDPHVWLSPRNAKIIVQNIVSELVIADSSNAPTYAANSERFLAELDALDEAYTIGLAQCLKDTIFVTHNAFAYLGHDYGFETISISGLSHDVEPTAAQIVALIDEAKYHNITVVFVEELASSGVAQTIASEINGQVLSLNDASGSVSGKTYIEMMKENLINLQIGLDCTV
jgi:zinc transport system substrate-binding protein